MPKWKGLNLLGDFRISRVGLVKKGETLDQKVEERQLCDDWRLESLDRRVGGFNRRDALYSI